MLCWQVLEFSIKKEMTLEMWTDRQDKIQTFFGPGVQADIQKTDQVCAHHQATQQKGCVYISVTNWPLLSNFMLPVCFPTSQQN